jgi:tetratricopeptide (TPR) repeat protein
MFAVQDKIAKRIAGAIEPELLRAAPIVFRHTGNITAWDLVRQGTFRFHQLRRETHLEARELFRRAAALDPQLPEAHLWIARVNAGLVAYGWTNQVSEDIAEGRAAGRRAIELDERNPYAHYGLAIVSAYGGHFEEAVRAAEQAIETAPSFALGHLVLGMSRLFSGDAQSAVGPLEHGLHLSPHDPQNFVWYAVLALSHLFTGSPKPAHEIASRALKIRPGWRTALEVLVACSVALGDSEEAEVRRYEFHASKPLSGDVLAPLRAHNADWAVQLSTAVNG